MQTMTEELAARAKALMADGTVTDVLGWKRGDLGYDPTPWFFDTAEALSDFVCDGFCGANLSKYLVERGKKPGKTLVFLKPCDTYSLNELIKEYRVSRDRVYVVGVACAGMLDIEKIRDRGIKGIRGIEEHGADVVADTVYGRQTCPRDGVLLEKCMSCKGAEHMIYDELAGTDAGGGLVRGDRFAPVAELEALEPEARFAFWREELSRCIRCNACRNVCPVCSCRKCVFDNQRSGVAGKANADSFDENLYHIIRAFHVAGRCTDCGECSRVCPQGIPLHLINRKLIKDINRFYGEYQAGTDTESCPPLTGYAGDDVEADVIRKGGAK